MREFKTRKPSGRASFPLVLLSGQEGTGKTWAAVETTAMEQVDRAFFIEVGESQADAYGAVPGADFEIIEHDGTIRNIREALQWAAAQEPAEGKFNLLIIDSMTQIWQLLQDNGQQEANRRARRKGKQIPEEGVRLSMDLWNQIKEVWNGILQQCRHFPGPVLMTSRLELVTAMDDKGNPTRDKQWKIQAEKNIPYNCQVVLQARAPRQWTLTKIATTVPELQLPVGGEIQFNDFSVEKLLTSMGIAADAAPTTYIETRPDGEFDEEKQREDAERAEREAAEERRKSYVSTQAQGLMDAEKNRDLDKLNAALRYYQQQGDGQLVQMAQETIQRLQKVQSQEAQETVKNVLDGEVVEDSKTEAA